MTRLFLSFVIAITCFATAFMARAETLPDDPALVAAAKAEGKVTLYTSAFGHAFSMDVKRKFEKKYGISVELLDVRASELIERMRTEQAAGRFIGDVVQIGPSTTYGALREGLLQPYGSVPNTRRLLPQYAATDMVVPSYIYIYGILINTKLVKPADEPKSWKDLLDPRWQGKMLADDQSSLGGGGIMFAALQRVYGRVYHEKLAAQHPIFGRDVGNDERRVARGEYPLRFPQLAQNALLLKGLPVKMIIPPEGVPYARYDMAMQKNAPHPNAARLLMNYCLSDEIQLVYANAGLLPVVAKLDGHVSDDVREIMNAKLLGTVDMNDRDAMLALAKEIYK